MDRDPRGRSFRAGLGFGAWNGLTWMIGLGTPMVLLAQQLGANALQVGLASSFVFLVLPVQVFATATLARLGYRRQMVLGWSARALFLLVPLGLALGAPDRPAPWMADLFVASVCGFCLFRAFGAAAHVPWFADIFPGSMRGRFFATDAALTSLVGVGTLLLCAALFARLPAWPAFAIVYALALLGSVLAVSHLLRLPSSRPRAPVALRTLHREARRLCVAPGPFRLYLGLALLGAAVTTSIGPFTSYYLKVEAGLEASRILSLTAVQFAGQIAGGASIRRVIDRLPLRRFFQLATLGVAAVQLFWLACLARPAELLPWLPLAYFAFGATIGISNSAHATVLPELSDEASRPVSVSVFTAVQGLVSGAAPIAWGLVLREAGAAPGLEIARFELFFAIGAAANALAAVRFARLRETRGARPR